MQYTPLSIYLVWTKNANELPPRRGTRSAAACCWCRRNEGLWNVATNTTTTTRSAIRGTENKYPCSLLLLRWLPAQRRNTDAPSLFTRGNPYNSFSLPDEWSCTNSSSSSSSSSRTINPEWQTPNSEIGMMMMMIPPFWSNSLPPTVVSWRQACCTKGLAKGRHNTAVSDNQSLTMARIVLMP